MSDWCHNMLEARVPDASGFGHELVDGERRPIPLERFTEEGKAREVRRLNDQLGEDLGVGPYPGCPS